MATAYRILVTGSRDWPRRYLVTTALDLEAAIARDQGRAVTVVHGGCRTGADFYAHSWALQRGITIEEHSAQWRTYGRAAGPMRNRQMVNLGADVVLAFIFRGSPGATGCSELARLAGLTVNLFELT